MNRRGLALILVAGVLGILAVLGAAFVTMAQLERRASQQRLNATKAALLARSGIEDALARLTAGQEPAYGGEDWALDGYDPYDQAQEVFGPGALDLEACPARHALRPSWFKRDGTGKPWRTPVAGRDRGHSGELRAGAHYVQKVVPAEGIFVNGGDLSSGGEHAGTYDTTLKRILGNLAEEVGLVRAQGEALVTSRPQGGWTSSSQLPSAMRPYLVIDAWVDKKVIRPNVDPGWTPPLVGYVGAQTPASWAEIKVGRRDTPIVSPCTFGDPAPTGCAIGTLWSNRRAFNTRTNSYAPDFERDGTGRIVGRAPVNLNWAKDKPPVLRALLRDLRGIYLDSTLMIQTTGVSIGSEDQGHLGVFRAATLSPPYDAWVVDALQTHDGFPTWVTEYPDWDRTPSFDSWDEFNRFVDLKLAALPKPQRDLLKAHFNPNSDLNKFNPGETLSRLLDKSDLTGYSTEFSFRTPVFDVSCSGHIVDAQGRVLAERVLSARSRLEQLRLTTQSEFCAGNLGSLQVAGDETAFRRPGDAGFLEKSSGTDPTYGSRFPGCAPGFALQTYPEPQWAAGACPVPAPYDGRLELATIETEASPAAEPGLTFLASFDDGYDATWGVGDRACDTAARTGPVTGSLLGNGPVGTTARLNMLYPDGCYSEASRAPGYASRDNVGNGIQGILSFWFKPSVSQGYGTSADTLRRKPTLFSLNRLALDPVTTSSTLCCQSTQSFQLGLDRRGGGKGYLGVILENAVHMQDIAHEHGSNFGWLTNPRTFWVAHRWHLVTVQWNLRAGLPSAFSHILLNDTSHLSTEEKHYTGEGGAWTLSGTAERITDDGYRMDGSFGPHPFYLGSRGYTIWHCGSADGTFDEFACFTRSTSMNDSAELAAPRFAAGRYSKEDASLAPANPEYCSAPIPLGAGARLVRADWTLMLPRPTPAPSTAPDFWPLPNQVFYGTGEDPLAGETADAAIRLLDGAGAPLPSGALAGRSGASMPLSLPGGTLKLGIDIRPRLEDNKGDWHKLSAPLLESPVLDDVTLTYTGPEGPRLESWREGE